MYSHGESVQERLVEGVAVRGSCHTGSGLWRLLPLWNGWNGFVWRIGSGAACRGGGSERVFPHRHRIAVIAAVVEWVEWVRMENRFRAACRGGSSERVLPHLHRIAAIAAVEEWVEEGSEEECREKGLRTGSHISWYRRCRRNASFVGPFSAAFMTDRLSVQRHARDL